MIGIQCALSGCSRAHHSDAEEPPLTLCCDGAAPAGHVTASRAIPHQDAGGPAAGRWLRLTLAALWLLDAALQFQSFMFGQGFSAMLAQSARGNPAVVAVPITWAAQVIGQHPAAANAAFGAIQLALGLGIAWRPTVKIALAGSIGWALAVWWLGEGFGGLLSGTASPVSGAPGAAAVYALLAMLLWPPARAGRQGVFPAAQAAGPARARAAWVLLWGGLAWLAAAGAPAATMAVFRQPGGSLLLAVVLVLIAAGVLLPAPVQRGAVVAAVVLSLLLWGYGQGFGGVFTGTGTDPSTGPLLALLALAYWPARRAAVHHPGRSHPAPWHSATGDPTSRHPAIRQPASGHPATGLPTSGHCASRRRGMSGTGSWPGLPAAGRDAVVMQALMGLGMAGMLLPGALPVPQAAWIVLAGAGTAWFGARFVRGLAHAHPGQQPALDHLPHAVACAAMLCMFAAGMPGRAGTAPGVMGAGPGVGPAPVAALILAAALAGCAVILTDRLAAPRPILAAGRAAAGSGLLARRVTACCQLAMGVGMACMLVQLL